MVFFYCVSLKAYQVKVSNFLPKTKNKGFCFSLNPYLIWRNISNMVKTPLNCLFIFFKMISKLLQTPYNRK